MSEKDLSYYLDQIDEYLDGSLSQIDHAEFQQAVQANPALQEEIQNHIMARASIRHHGEQELKNKFKQAFSEEATGPADYSNSKPFPWKLLLVLLPLLALLAYFFLTQQNSEEPAEEDLWIAGVEDPSYDLLRGEADTLHARQWSQAVFRFTIKDYGNSLSILDSFDQQSAFLQKHQGKYALMKGVSLLKLERFDEAEAILQTIDVANPYHDQSVWYLALTAYYDGQQKLASERLTAISQLERHYKKQEALRYLKALE